MANRTRTNRNEFHLSDKDQFILDEKFKLSGMKSKSESNELCISFYKFK